MKVERIVTKTGNTHNVLKYDYESEHEGMEKFLDLQKGWIHLNPDSIESRYESGRLDQSTQMSSTIKNLIIDYHGEEVLVEESQFDPPLQN